MPDRRVIQELLCEDPDYVVLTPAYPNLLTNGGEFIRTRVRAYRARGLVGHVIQYSAPAGSEPVSRRIREGTVSVVGPDALKLILDHIRLKGVPVVAHSPTPALSRLLPETLEGKQFAIWYHGFEVRDYRRLLFNYDTKSLSLRRTSLDKMNAERFAVARPLFADGTITKVFVSHFQRRYSEWDVGTEARNSHIIPNHIDTEAFQPRVRRPDEAKKILLLRSFARRNYANDVALKAIQILAARNEHHGLQVTVRGFGDRFEEEVGIVRHLPHVAIQHAYSGPAEMAMLHYDHGVFLCPSRFDTQGVTLGEAMASGMVTITNPVGGIPEYTDQNCSLLPRTDDPWAFAEAILHLVHNPDLMPGMSRNAAERVARQCGVGATIERELEIVRSLSA